MSDSARAAIEGIAGRLIDAAPTSRRFELHRDVDVTGISGTGVVADGVEFPDGTVAIRWRGERPSAVFWSGMDHVEAIHGHNGSTRVVWLDRDSEPSTP